MIYLFDKEKQLYIDYPIIDGDDIRSLPERRKIKGVWTVSAEIRVRGIYTHVEQAAYIGFYDEERKFQLYKIEDLQVTNDFFILDGIFTFFDEAYAGEVIRDRRFVDRQANVAALAAFEPIGWELDGHDFTDEKTTNFYYLSPLEAKARIEEVWGVEFNFWLVFDGQKILGQYYELRKQIGEDSNVLYEYEENIKSITHTQSRQDIVTAVLPRGRGELLEGDTYGRSIQIDDVVWSKSNGDPLDKPAGQDYLELPEMTAIWGYDGVKPRIRKVDFSDEEDENNLIQLAYDWLLENCMPKFVFKLVAPDNAVHRLGDSVMVSYKEIGLASTTRVFEVEHNHKTGRTVVEFGDVELKSDKRLNSIGDTLKSLETANSRVVEEQRKFNDAFDRKVLEMEREYEQAFIDAQAEIQAAEQRMADLIGGVREDFDSDFFAEVERIEREAEQEYNSIRDKIESDISNARSEMESDFNAEVERIEQEALAEYERISGEITTSIGQARSEIEQDYSQAVQSARDYADAEILAKEQQYEEDWNIRDAAIQSTIEQIVGGSVDSLDTSLLEIDSNLLTINSKLLDKLEIEDISDLYANVDTLTTNLNTARNDLDTARDDLDTARADLDTTRDDLNSTRDDLQAKLDDAKAEFDNLEIGGRNLFSVNQYVSLRNSEGTSNGRRYSVGSSGALVVGGVDGSGGYDTMKMVDLKADTEYIFTFNIPINDRFSVYDIDGIIVGGVKNWNNDNTQLTIQMGNVDGYIGGKFYPIEQNYPVEIYLMAERGNKATDWTPAPEDVETKITTLEQDIQYIDGELSAKLSQTDIEPFVNRITQAEADIIVSATEISTLQQFTVSLDEGITQWSNFAQSTADEVNRVLTRVSDTESGLESAKTDISATANGLSALVTRTEDVEGEVSQLETDLSVTADGLSALITRTSTAEGKITNAETRITTEAGRIDSLLARTSEVEDGIELTKTNITTQAGRIDALVTRTSDVEDGIESAETRITTEAGRIDTLLSRTSTVEGKITVVETDISATADGLSALVTRTEATEDGLSQAQSAISANADAITARVTRTELEELVENRNLLLNSDFKNGSNNWVIFYDGNAVFTENYVLLHNDSPTEENGFYQSVFSPRGDIDSDDDEVVTVSVWLKGSGVLYVKFGASGQSNVIDHAPFNSDDIIKISGSNSNTGNGNLIFGLMGEGSAEIHRVKLEKGTIATDWTPSPRDTDAKVTQLATELAIEAGLIEATMARVDDAETAISTFQATADGFRADVGRIEEDVLTEFSTIDQRFDSITNQVANINTWHYNLLRGTRFDEDRWEPRSGKILTDEDVNYFYFDPDATGANGINVLSNEPIQFTEGEQYTLSWDYQSFGTTLIDNVWLITTAEDGSNNIAIHHPNNHDEANLTVHLGAEYRRYWIRFTAPRDVEAYVRIGVNSNNNPQGRIPFKIRLPYLTTTNRTQWLYHQLDNTQNLEEIVNRISTIEQTADNIRAEVTSLTSDTDDLLNWRAEKGTIFEQTADAITAKVWQSDIDNIEIGARNLIPMSDVPEQRSEWTTWGGGTSLVRASNEHLEGYMWVYRNNASSGSQIGAITPRLTKDIIAGVPYTVRFKATHFRDTDPDMTYMYFMYDNHSNASFAGRTLKKKYFRTNLYSDEWIYEITAIPIRSGSGRIMIGTTGTSSADGQISFYIKEPMVVEGTRVTGDYQTAPEDSLMKTDFILRSDGFFLGGNYVGGEHYSTAIIGNADGLKLLGDTIIDGNLYVKETIESYALNAVEANIGSLFASTANIDFIRARHMNANSVGAKHLYVDNALINKLSASTIFTNMLSTKTLDAIDANIGSVRTSLLTANVITSGMIQSSNATIDKIFSNNARIDRLFTKTHFTNQLQTKSLEAIDANIGSVRTSLLTSNVITSGMIQSSNATINKLFSNNARIDTLISKSHFVDEIKTMSLSAVDADIANLRTNILTTDVIKSRHMSASNFMVDKMFGTTALIERLTSKTAFISYVRSHIIDADTVRVGFNGISSNVTIDRNGIVIDGGALTVNRHDGGAPTIIDGANPSGINLFPATPHRRDSGFTVQGQYAVRESGSNLLIYDFYMFEWFYTDLIFDFAIYNFETHDIRVRIEILGTDGSTFSRAVDYTVPSTGVRVAFPRLILKLGVPDGSVQRFFIRTRNVGTSSSHGKYGIHTYMVKHLDNGHGFPRLEDDGLQ